MPSDTLSQKPFSVNPHHDTDDLILKILSKPVSVATLSIILGRSRQDVDRRLRKLSRYGLVEKATRVESTFWRRI